ncbi:YciI family protein [Trinickia sp.]|uniref:YciI family protein n=1 Tax=Trinickia sp. TaxID=2571163 RepID=UPI003F7F19DA
MSYLLLIVEPVGQRAERTPDEARAAYDSMLRFGADLKERGLLVAAQSLASTDEAVRVELRGGERRLIDGPFVEAKEMVGGFYLLNCDREEDALAIAAECPAAQWCTVEVRRLAPCYE